MPSKCFCHSGWSQFNTVPQKHHHLPQYWSRQNLFPIQLPLAVLKAKTGSLLPVLQALHAKCHQNTRAVCWGSGLLEKASHCSWCWQTKTVTYIHGDRGSQLKSSYALLLSEKKRQDCQTDSKHIFSPLDVEYLTERCLSIFLNRAHEGRRAQ